MELRIIWRGKGVDDVVGFGIDYFAALAEGLYCLPLRHAARQFYQLKASDSLEFLGYRRADLKVAQTTGKGRAGSAKPDEDFIRHVAEGRGPDPTWFQAVVSNGAVGGVNGRRSCNGRGAREQHRAQHGRHQPKGDLVFADAPKNRGIAVNLHRCLPTRGFALLRAAFL